VRAAGGCLIDSFVIAICIRCFYRLGTFQPAETDGALGVIESFNVATLTKPPSGRETSRCCNSIEVRLAMAMGGKAFCSMTGDVVVGAIRCAAGRAVLAEAACS